jgi:hypothetical protein
MYVRGGDGLALRNGPHLVVTQKGRPKPLFKGMVSYPLLSARGAGGGAEQEEHAVGTAADGEAFAEALQVGDEADL